GRRERQADQERAERRRRGGVRPLAHRADPVRSGATRAGRSRLGPGLLAFGLALAVLECAWLYWFLTEPLPNSAPVGRPKLPRSDLLWRALPGVVPGVRLEQSLLGPALRDLSHFENLPQRVPIVLAAGLIALAAMALGDL